MSCTRARRGELGCTQPRCGTERDLGRKQGPVGCLAVLLTGLPCAQHGVEWGLDSGLYLKSMFLPRFPIFKESSDSASLVVKSYGFIWHFLVFLLVLVSGVMSAFSPFQSPGGVLCIVGQQHRRWRLPLRRAC